MSFYDELTKEAISPVLDPIEEKAIEAEYNATIGELDALFKEAKEAMHLEASLSKAVEGMQQHPEAVAVITVPTVEAYKAFTNTHIEPTEEGFKEALANIKKWLNVFFKKAKRLLDKLLKVLGFKDKKIKKDIRDNVSLLETVKLFKEEGVTPTRSELEERMRKVSLADSTANIETNIDILLNDIPADKLKEAIYNDKMVGYARFELFMSTMAGISGATLINHLYDGTFRDFVERKSLNYLFNHLYDIEIGKIDGVEKNITFNTYTLDDTKIYGFEEFAGRDTIDGIIQYLDGKHEYNFINSFDKEYLFNELIKHHDFNVSNVKLLFTTVLTELIDINPVDITEDVIMEVMENTKSEIVARRNDMFTTTDTTERFDKFTKYLATTITLVHMKYLKYAIGTKEEVNEIINNIIDNYITD